MIFVTDAKYVSDYVIWVAFSNRQQGVVDLGETICKDHRPIFAELKDKEKFQRLRVDMDTVVWENGLDLAPEFLLEKLKDTKTNDEFFSKMNS